MLKILIKRKRLRRDILLNTNKDILLDHGDNKIKRKL
jgi:hypothetical protein